MFSRFEGARPSKKVRHGLARTVERLVSFVVPASSHRISLLPTCFFPSLDIPDSVVGAEANPLGNGAVLLAGLGQLLLGAERLERL